MHDHTLSSDKKDILTPAQKVSLARNINRPHIDDFIHALFTDFFEQKGDHLYDEDRSILGGIALPQRISCLGVLQLPSNDYLVTHLRIQSPQPQTVHGT